MSVRWWSAATQGEYALWSPHDEAEGYDRTSLRLPGMQEGLLQHLARLTDTPLVRRSAFMNLSTSAKPPQHGPWSKCQ